VRLLPLVACMSIIGACASDQSASPEDAVTAPPRDAGNTTTTPDAGADGARPGRFIEATNPVLPIDHPDPDVLRVVGADGKPTYYLTATVDTGDIDVFTSKDLALWKKEEKGLFGRASTKGRSLEIHGRHYCAIWAPQLFELGPSSFLLSFTASRFAAAQVPCPVYGENGGSYWATASSPLGPFATDDRPLEPAAFGASPTCAIANDLPRSRDVVADDCQGGFCHHVVRLDGHVFRDPKDGRVWGAYSWYTNTPPLVDFEKQNHGEHVHLVELDPKDPRYVRCDASTPQVFVANPHDNTTKTRLQSSCPRCGEMLAFGKGRQDEDVTRDGVAWGVVEGASLVRHGDHVYLFISHSIWDSAYYSVYWAAAKTVEELRYENAKRLVGRFLIPSKGQSFGHGSPVLGPDGTTLYFLHHRLDHGPCKALGSCGRDVWLSPIEFEDRGDGLGPAWVKPRFPAEDPKVRLFLPD
jgi:beta-xylosidase